MAEGRMIKRVIAKSKKMARLKNEKARVLYFMIYPHVDVKGRFSSDAEDIKAVCIPLFDWSLDDTELALKDLHNIGLINLYIINTKRYLEIVKFREHNRVYEDREAQSLIPAANTDNILLRRSTQELSCENRLSKEVSKKGMYSSDHNNDMESVDNSISLIESSKSDPQQYEILKNIGVVKENELNEKTKEPI